MIHQDIISSRNYKKSIIVIQCNLPLNTQLCWLVDYDHTQAFFLIDSYYVLVANWTKFTKPLLYTAVLPSSFHVTQGSEVNGSSPVGNCTDVSLVQMIGGNFTQFLCSQPTSSVLFDGNIPTLTGLDGNMWARELLTLYTTGSSVEVDLSGNKQDLVGVNRLEISMFNCPEWGIGAGSISFFNSESYTD